MKLLVLPGDGIGPEITAATLAVLESADRKFKLGLPYEEREIGLTSLKSRARRCRTASWTARERWTA